MTRRTTSASRPWEAPGYRFLTDEACVWLGGFKPQGMQPSLQPSLSAEQAERARQGRERNAAAGTGWGKGTIPGGLGSGKGAR